MDPWIHRRRADCPAVPVPRQLHSTNLSPEAWRFRGMVRHVRSAGGTTPARSYAAWAGGAQKTPANRLLMDATWMVSYAATWRHIVCALALIGVAAQRQIMLILLDRK